MNVFEPIDISGDVGIRAFGKTQKELFINAALGMYSLIGNLESVQARKTLEVAVESDSLEGLIVSWLNELIFHFDTYNFIGKNIVLNQFRPNRLSARIAGEDFQPARHGGNLLIKAATYHLLKIEQTNSVWKAEVIFDI